MLSYLTAFIFYTFAMVGIMLLAFVIYKKFNFPLKQENKGIIHIVDSCPIGAKKNLLVVKIANEKFLIASGLEHTTFLAKLDNSINQTAPEVVQTKNTEEKFKNITYKKPQEEKDIYDFLYTQSKKLENQNTNMQNQNYSYNKPEETENDKLKVLFNDENKSQLNSAIDSRRKLMQELLDEIHQKKNKTGSRF